jgi:hypothetical protein
VCAHNGAERVLQQPGSRGPIRVLLLGAALIARLKGGVRVLFLGAVRVHPLGAEGAEGALLQVDLLTLPLPLPLPLPLRPPPPIRRQQILQQPAALPSEGMGRHLL